MIGRWQNPEGGETVEFTADGAIHVRRGTEDLTTQQYIAEDNGAGAGRLFLRAAGGGNEVILGYCVSPEVLAMSYGGETSIYVRVRQ